MTIDHEVTLRKIKAAYTGDKKESDLAKWWGYYGARLPPFYLTWPFLKLRISANSATWFTTGVGLLGAGFLAYGEYWTALVGAFLVNLWLVLDCVDGNIARYHKQCSKYGDFLDSVSGYVMLSTMFFATGIGIFRGGDSAVFLILGAGASIASIYPRLVYQKMLSYLGQGVLYGSVLDRKKKGGKGLFSLAFRIGNHLANPGAFLLPILFTFALTNQLRYALCFYCAIYLGIAVISTRQFVAYMKTHCP